MVDSGSTRRTILQGVGTGITAGLAGCFSSEGSDGGGGGTTTKAVQTGGTLKFGATTTADSLNPLIADAQHEMLIDRQMYAYLMELNPDLTTKTELAKSWEVNDDATQWTVTIRDDFTFHHNGNTVLAEDVAATMNSIVREESTHAGAGVLGPIDNAEVVNDTTVQINLTGSDGALKKRWAHNYAAIVPKAIADDGDRWSEMASNDFGAGPFKLDSFSSGGTTTLSAYEDYPMTDDQGTQLPYVDAIEVETLPDSSSLVTSFTNGDIDLLWKTPRSQWSRVSNTDGVTANKIKSAAHALFSMDVTQEPFSNNSVRKAFKLAVDRESLVEGAISGLGNVAYDHPIAPAYPVDIDVGTRSQDLEQANSLLQEAGYGEGGETLNLDLKTSTEPQYVLDTTVLAAEQFNELDNVNVTVVQQSYDTWISETWTKGQFYSSWYSSRAMPDNLLFRVYRTGGPWNETGYGNEELDKAMTNAQKATSTEDRQAGLQEAAQILYDEGPAIIPYYRNVLGGYHNYVNGYKTNSTQKEMLAEDIWLDNV